MYALEAPERIFHGVAPEQAKRLPWSALRPYRKRDYRVILCWKCVANAIIAYNAPGKKDGRLDPVSITPMI